MERTKNKQKWRKIGGGVLRIGARTIRSGDVFFADASEIPQSFHNMLVELSPAPMVEKEEPEPALPAYEVCRVGAGWFDVVNVSTGKPINAKRLRAEAAEALLKTLL